MSLPAPKNLILLGICVNVEPTSQPTSTAMSQHKQLICDAFKESQNHSNWQPSPALKDAVQETLHQLDSGELRVASPSADGWVVHAWLKQAILLFFRLHQNTQIDGQYTQFYDKVPVKYHQHSAAKWSDEQVRVVPPATARFGSYMGPQCVLMPSYVNIGAYIDSGSMVDTWATVGLRTTGKNVHLSEG